VLLTAGQHDPDDSQIQQFRQIIPMFKRYNAPI